MAYFDPNKDTVLIVDASPVGLAALLTQDNKISTYASRSLTDVETRYSQTEKEGLAILWSIEHVHLYLYGHKCTLVSDHQPLETIFNNPKSKIPARIERLQQYNFNVKYKPGNSCRLYVQTPGYEIDHVQTCRNCRTLCSLHFRSKTFIPFYVIIEQRLME